MNLFSLLSTEYFFFFSFLADLFAFSPFLLFLRSTPYAGAVISLPSCPGSCPGRKSRSGFMMQVHAHP